MPRDHAASPASTHAPGERRQPAHFWDGSDVAPGGRHGEVADRLPDADVPEETLVLTLLLPQLQVVAAPAAHVRLLRKLKLLIAEDADEEQATAALRHAVVRGEEDLLGDGVTEFGELVEYLGAELAALPVGHSRHV